MLFLDSIQPAVVHVKHIHAYIYIYIHTHTRMHACLHTHTHTHTHVYACILWGYYLILQAWVVTSCRLVYCINVVLAADRPHVQRSKGEDCHVTVVRLSTVYRHLFCKVICLCTSARPVNVVLAARVITVVACCHSNCTGQVAMIRISCHSKPWQ